MESLLDCSLENKGDDDYDHSNHNYDEMVLDDLLLEFLPSDDEWPLGMTFNEVDACFALSSSSSTTIHTVNTNNNSTSLESLSIPFSVSSSFSSSSSSSFLCPSSSSDFSEEPLGDDVNLQPVKKRRKRNRPRANLFPRIFKNDIRRILPQMYFNTVNSGDMALYQRFLSEFCVGSCCMMDNLDDSCICQTLKAMKPLTIRGLDNVTNILSKRIGSFPDIVSHIEKSWIRHQLNTPGSAVIAKVKVQGTLSREHLVEMPSTVCRLPFFIVDALSMAGQLPMFMRKLDGATDRQYIQGCMVSFFDVLIEAEVVFHVDNDNRIYRLEFHGRLHVNAT
eukprot:scaffold98_cov248-Ochromonas_danica.AAC.28